MNTSKTARTWDSYKEALLLVLDDMRPERCFEWGIGKSTETISLHPSVKSLDSVEHNDKWYSKYKKLNDQHLLPNVNIVYEHDELLYPLVCGRYDEYDLIFVDGILREKCLNQAKEILAPGGVVILHDAERLQYREAINDYVFAHWVDNGNTVLLTDEISVHQQLVGVILQCKR